MKKHFVNFLSPGTFVDEVSTREIDEWDVDEAMRMATEITERHGARPYGFRFSTRERTDDELDSKTTDEGVTYYLGGRVLTLDDVKREMPDESILISNMKCNGWDKIIINTNSYKITKPLLPSDVVLAA